ncbi:MAG: type II toxin-antitoxin system PemK/MazF family toxin [Xanthomonadaceae bacterium]|nr:type II toxin-antitoxin system PemK/MazF family toxin [Xanthomonadaceae bacterium]
MQRGEIWVASFKPWRGMEVGRARPCVIVQADWLTAETAGTLIVLPLTSQLWAGADPLRVEIRQRRRLQKSSWVMIDKIQALDSGRFRDGPLGDLDDSEMAVIEQKLKAVLGMM